jgi:hypothetical protein
MDDGEHQMTTRRYLTILPLCGLLAACGGSGGGGEGDGGATDAGALPAPGPAFPDIGLDVAPVMADGSPIATRDYVGRTFPLLTLVGSPRGNPAATVGEITIVDSRNIVVRLPGRAPLTLTSDGGSPLYSDGSGEEWLIGGNTAANPAKLTLRAIRGSLFESAFGFETPVAARPTTATYRGSSTISLEFANGALATLQGLGDVDLTATFTGAGGTISGTLMDAGADRDLDLNGVDDVLLLRADLDGVIVPEGFTGSVAAQASVRIDGGPASSDLDLRLSNEVVAGKFFGNAAEAAAGVFSADVAATIPGPGAVSGTMAGQFFTTAP